MTDLLIRHIRWKHAEAYVWAGWTLQGYRYGAVHRSYGLMAIREARD